MRVVNWHILISSITDFNVFLSELRSAIKILYAFICTFLLSGSITSNTKGKHLRILPDVPCAEALHTYWQYLVFLDFSEIQNTIKPQQLFHSESSIRTVWHSFSLRDAKAEAE